MKLQDNLFVGENVFRGIYVPVCVSYLTIMIIIKPLGLILSARFFHSFLDCNFFFLKFETNGNIYQHLGSYIWGS